MNVFYSLLVRTIGAAAALVLICASVVNAQWTTSTPIPLQTTGYQGAAGATYNGAIYTFGGFSGTGFVNKVYKFDMATETWSEVGTNPYPYLFSQAVTIGNKIYIFGGSDTVSLAPYHMMNRVSVFDPATNTFSQAKNMPQMIAGHNAVVVGGKAYVFGGVKDSVNGSGTHQLFVHADMFAYDPANDSWTTIANSVPYAAYFAQATAIGNKVYLAGGLAASGGVYPYSVVATVTNGAFSWTQIANTPSIRAQGGMTSLSNMPLIAGGITDQSSDPTDTWLYDGAVQQWLPLAKIPAVAPLPVVEGDGTTAFVIGGATSNAVYKGVDENPVPVAQVYYTTISLPMRPGDIEELEFPIGNIGRAELEATLAFTGTSWATGSAATVGVAQSKILKATLNATGVAPGNYTISGTITTNDAKNPTIGVTINVVVNANLKKVPTIAVLEESHGAWCPPCGTYGVPAVEALEAEHGDRLVVLSNHDKGGSRYDPFSTTAGEALNSRLGLNAYPTGSVHRIRWNGTNQQLSAGSEWESAIQSLFNTNPYATVIVGIDNYSYDPATRKVQGTITLDNDLPVNLPFGVTMNVTAMVKESGLSYPQYFADKPIETILHENVVRYFYPDNDGQELTIPAELKSGSELKVGSHMTYDFSFTVPETTTATSTTPLTGLPVVGPVPVKPNESNIVFLVTMNQGTTLNEVVGVLEHPLTENVGSTGSPVVSVSWPATTSSSISAATTKEFEFTVTNLTDANQAVTITRTKNTMPSGWYSEICTSSSDCGDNNTVNYTLAESSAHSFTLKVYGANSAEQGTVTLMIQSGNVTETKTFNVSTTSSSVAVAGEAGQLSMTNVSPNPASATTRIDLRIPVAASTSLEIFSVTGEKVATIFDGKLEAGDRQITADVSNLEAGKYVLVLKSGDKTVSRTLTIVR